MLLLFSSVYIYCFIVAQLISLIGILYYNNNFAFFAPLREKDKNNKT